MSLSLLQSDLAEALLIAFVHGGDVFEINRGAVTFGDDNVAHLVDRTKQADSADIDGLAAERNVAAADIGVGVLNCGDNLRQSEVVLQQLVGIDFSLVLARGAAEDG